MANQAAVPWLESPRLQLREFVPEDCIRLVEMHKDSRLSELLLDRQPFEQYGFSTAFIRRMMEVYREYEGLGVWAAERMTALLSEDDLANPLVRKALSDEALETYSKPRAQFIGWFNLMPVPHQLEEIEIGSRLIPAVWGSGLAIEGGEMLLAHAFERLRREQVWAFSHPAHRAVHYVVQTLGFKDFGMDTYADQPARVYKIKRTEWQEWLQIPRKRRMRHAIKACKSLPVTDNVHEIKACALS